MIGKRVLVEGETDRYAVKSLGNFSSRDFQLAGGFSRLVRQIEPEIIKDAIRRLGIVFDANGCLERQWQKVRKKFLKPAV